MYGQEFESKYKIDESGLNNSTCGKSFKILWVKVENKFKMRNAMQKKKKKSKCHETSKKVYLSIITKVLFIKEIMALARYIWNIKFISPLSPLIS